MRNEGRMNEEWWKLKDEGWLFQAVEGFLWLTDEKTNKQTFVNAESLLQLKRKKLAKKEKKGWFLEWRNYILNQQTQSYMGQQFRFLKQIV